MTRLLTAFLLIMALPATASAAAPSCPDDNADELGGSGEVWGIGPRYVIAGVPERGGGAGAIVVRDGGHPARTVTLAHIPGAGAPTAGDRFGAALASERVVDGRPCTDILAGAPGRGGTGEAYLLFGSTSARPRAAALIRAPDAAPGDDFGAAVAISSRSDALGHDLWIGAPGRDVAGQADAGAIYHYVVSFTGEVTAAGIVTEGATLDAPEAGDRLGEVLAPASGGVVAGIPHEDAGAGPSRCSARSSRRASPAGTAGERATASAPP